ncbi:MAG: MFS transporter [Magnetospirillum sp.]|nr:MFS transporter [Magnetospirillum sp.]
MSRCAPAFSAYLDRRVLMVLALGFSSGLPLLLTLSTLSAWLTTVGVNRATVGYFALVQISYSFKFVWSPVIDRLDLPLLTRLLGRRRSWALTIQLLLMAALLAMGSTDPATQLHLTGLLAALVAFLSASQDIVIDAYRVEILDEDHQGPGAAAVQTGYRLAMLVAGAGALYIASSFGWFAAYATMAALLGVGMLVFLFGPEPQVKVSPTTVERERRAQQYLADHPTLKGGWAKIVAWLYGAVFCPFADFMSRPAWLAILLFVMGYKLGESMAGTMAMRLYQELGFSLDQIATVSKLFGFGATIAGTLIGGALIARLGIMRALLLFGLLQSAGNLFYVLQAMAGNDVVALAICVAVENLTAGMAGAALIAYISGLCNAAYTATQYALLSSLTAAGRSLFSSSTGKLVDWMGWVDFFLLTTVVTLPALGLLMWMMRRDSSTSSEGQVAPPPSDGIPNPRSS